MWTDEDLNKIVKVCQYVSDNLPDEAFGLHGVPGLRIFPEPNCIAIGTNDWSVGSYSVIRGGTTGMVDVYNLSDRGIEAGGSPDFHRVIDAVKSIFFGWLLDASRLRTRSVFSPEFCEQEATLTKFDWTTHRHLFTPEQQRFQEFMAQRTVKEEVSVTSWDGDVTTMLNWPNNLYQSKTNPDVRFRTDVESLHYRNLTYSLSVNPITFLDRAVVAIAEYKAAHPNG